MMLKNAESSAGRYAIICRRAERAEAGKREGREVGYTKAMVAMPAREVPLCLCNIPSDKAGVIKLARLARAFV